MLNDTLIELYDAQPISVDKLGGTNELAILIGEITRRTGVRVTESEILTRLINLRKRGLLAPKSDKVKHEAEKATWPKLVDGEFKVTIPVEINRATMIAVILDFCDTNKYMPATRQEVYDFLQVHPTILFSNFSGTFDVKSLETLRRLFPEFVQT